MKVWGKRASNRRNSKGHVAETGIIGYVRELYLVKEKEREPVTSKSQTGKRSGRAS